MSRNTKTHPHNKYIVNAQLDEYEYHVFTEMRLALGLNVSDALRGLVWSATAKYHRLLHDVKKDAASEAIFDDNMIEKRRIFNEIISEKENQ